MKGAQLQIVEHQDTGCPDGLLPSCLECPLVRCRYEEGEGDRQRKARERREIRELQDQGMTNEAVADALNISIRALYRRTSGR